MSDASTTSIESSQNDRRFSKTSKKSNHPNSASAFAVLLVISALLFQCYSIYAYAHDEHVASKIVTIKDLDCVAFFLLRNSNITEDQLLSFRFDDADSLSATKKQQSIDSIAASSKDRLSLMLESFIAHMRNGRLRKLDLLDLKSNFDRANASIPPNSITFNLDKNSDIQPASDTNERCTYLVNIYNIEAFKRKYRSSETELVDVEIASSRENLLEQFSNEELFSLCQISVGCHSPRELMNLILSQELPTHASNVITNGNLEYEEVDTQPSEPLSMSVTKLCPLMLFYMHDVDNSCEYTHRDDTPSLIATWAFATLFVTIVCFCSLIGVSIMAFIINGSQRRTTKDSSINESRNLYESRLKSSKTTFESKRNLNYSCLSFFEGLAVGSLVGSALFSLIPEAFELQERESNERFLLKALIIFLGIYLFFLSERIVRIIVDTRRRRKKSINSITLVSTTDYAENHQHNSNQGLPMNEEFNTNKSSFEALRNQSLLRVDDWFASSRGDIEQFVGTNHYEDFNESVNNDIQLDTAMDSDKHKKVRKLKKIDSAKKIHFHSSTRKLKSSHHEKIKEKTQRVDVELENIIEGKATSSKNQGKTNHLSKNNFYSSNESLPIKHLPVVNQDSRKHERNSRVKKRKVINNYSTQSSLAHQVNDRLKSQQVSLAFDKRKVSQYKVKRKKRSDRVINNKKIKRKNNAPLNSNTKLLAGADSYELTTLNSRFSGINENTSTLKKLTNSFVLNRQPIKAGRDYSYSSANEDDYDEDSDPSNQNESSSSVNSSLLIAGSVTSAMDDGDEDFGKENLDSSSDTENEPVRMVKLRARQLNNLDNVLIHIDRQQKFSRSRQTKKSFSKTLGRISSVAWMIMLGDGLHNFIDGISIGSAFSESILSGVSISVAVLCEEFPHELGDFAVLISSGLSTRQALGCNFLSACTCYLGMAVGIVFGDITESTSYISALAGGMFLYIALVNVTSEISAKLEETSRISIADTLKLFLLQNLGILLGISIIFTLSYFDFEA